MSLLLQLLLLVPGLHMLRSVVFVKPRNRGQLILMSIVSHCNVVQNHLRCEQVMHLDLRYLSRAIQEAISMCRYMLTQNETFVQDPHREFAVRIILSQTKQKNCQSLCTLLLTRSKKMAHQIQCMLVKRQQ